MSNLYELISKIQKRPSMYLGKPAISNLRSCIAGYILARRELAVAQTEQEKGFTEFQSWVQEKFNISSSQSWDKIILFYSEDEREALERFFELFQEYLKLNHLEFKSFDSSSEPFIKS
ncbi:hypothetical protein DSM106972_022770 [Dulcicalothrix desertica PCC 7102]|uniref:Uncharacterized protein n=1 Tax=Dulcicalothrix desertica PCC 7102 TaxID=232991 RepID=A0A3S1AQL3_9CYAN|nr:hypothetical protein [Dulcicalothrix desertica]RUT07016.1 hypothetical protein DSM106972_022770 [Dulcicalothrix desertica PCC 7102]TWH61988.1 hypothetical protein CAL7102_00672 [Dulcicalothrix desertica PCC 7102]